MTLLVQLSCLVGVLHGNVKTISDYLSIVMVRTALSLLSSLEHFHRANHEVFPVGYSVHIKKKHKSLGFYKLMWETRAVFP